MRLSWAPAVAVASLAACSATGCLDAERGEGDGGRADAAAGASDASAGGTDGGGGAADGAACGAILFDSFEDNAISGIWTSAFEGASSSSQLTEDGGVLTVEVELTPSDAYARLGLVSSVGYPDEGTTLTASVELATSGTGRAGIGWTTADGQYAAIFRSAGELVAARGMTPDAPVPLCGDDCPTHVNGDPVDIRLRADEDKIYFELLGSDMVWSSIATAENDLAGELLHAALFVEGTTSSVATARIQQVTWTPSCAESWPP